MKEQLILEVEKYPLLWDTAHPNHSKLNLTNNCWETIQEEMTKNFPRQRLKQLGYLEMKDLKQKWQALRTMYFRSKPKVPKSGSGLEDCKAPKWAYFKMLSFLDSGGMRVSHAQNSMTFTQTCHPDMLAREESTPGPSAGGDVPADLVEIPLEEQDSPEHISQGMDEPEVGRSLPSQQTNQSAVPTRPPGWSPSRQSSKYRRSKGKEDRSRSSERRTAVLESVAATLTAPKSEDDIFGHLVASKMRSMSPVTKSKVQVKILEILAESQATNGQPARTQEM